LRPASLSLFILAVSGCARSADGCVVVADEAQRGHGRCGKAVRLAVELSQRAAEITGQVLPGSYRPSRAGSDIGR